MASDFELKDFFAPSPCPACHARFDAPELRPWPRCPNCGYCRSEPLDVELSCPSCKGWLYDAVALTPEGRAVCAFCGAHCPQCE